jgi:oligopeptidase A
MQTLRQLEFANFDFRLHCEFDPALPDQIQKILNAVRQQTALYPIPSYNRFQHGFSHIFGGGYGAGYYSYQWALVWACDIFAKFEQQGIFDAATGASLLKNILAKANSEEPLLMFMAFQGRAPQINALLKHLQESA